jgi:hypothetical protein
MNDPNITIRLDETNGIATVTAWGVQQEFSFTPQSVTSLAELMSFSVEASNAIGEPEQNIFSRLARRDPIYEGVLLIRWGLQLLEQNKIAPDKTAEHIDSLLDHADQLLNFIRKLEAEWKQQ